MEIEKRSIVLTKDLAKQLEKLAVERGCSFSAIIRIACEMLVESDNKSFQLAVFLTNEERELVSKLSTQLGLENSSVIKKCFEAGTSIVIDEVQKKKKQIEEMNRKLS